MLSGSRVCIENASRVMYDLANEREWDMILNRCSSHPSDAYWLDDYNFSCLHRGNKNYFISFSDI